MDWFYGGMLDMHRALGWASIALLMLRGLALLWREELADDDRVRAISFGIHFLLAISGLSLWGLLHHNPLRDTWLLAKLLALAAYAPCAHWAIVKNEYRALAYVAALLLLGYAMATSLSRSALPGF